MRPVPQEWTALELRSLFPIVRGAPVMHTVTRRLALGIGLAALVALALASPATAAGPATGSATAPQAAPPPTDELGRGTPLGTVRGFLDATALRNYHRAMSYLDLRRLPQAEVATRG